MVSQVITGSVEIPFYSQYSPHYTHSVQSRSLKMLFTSLQYALFLPIFSLLYWVVPKRLQWVVILLASSIFYLSAQIHFFIIVLYITIISFVFAIIIEHGRYKKFFLICSIICCLAPLLFYKYINFAISNIALLLNAVKIFWEPRFIDVLLPIGISFYTFQALGYVLDVYMKETAAEHHFGKYASFILFFPQIVAGPIERSNNLLPQIKEIHTFNSESFISGLKTITWGVFKKIVIADNLALYVDMIYSDIYSYKGAALFFATLFFSIQIYCDFSGYTDIAIGSAKLFGISLTDNFDRPYFAQSLTDFWNRWHITLSSWFKRYIYIPLGGNRRNSFKTASNLIITFFLSGLWHGASYTFIIWGILHGVFLIIEKHINEKRYNHLPKPLKVTGTFIIITSLWVFFRANTLKETFYVLYESLDGIGNFANYLITGYRDLNLSASNCIILGLSVILLFIADFFKSDILSNKLLKRSLWLRWATYYIIILWILFFGRFSSNQFIYFQF